MLDSQKKKQLGILVKIAIVDEEFAEEEIKLIYKIGKSYGAEDQEIQEIFDNLPANDSIASMTVTEKMNFMMDCMLVVLADHVVTNSERSFARIMALKLGFRAEVVPFLFETKFTERSNMYDALIPYLMD